MDTKVATHRGGYLEALLNCAPEAVMAINAEGIITFANKEACTLSERNINELIGESIAIIYENKEAAREANRKIYEGGGTARDIELNFRTKSGKLIPIRLSASHLYDSNGKYAGGVGYFARYRPWAKAEADTKAHAEDLEARLECLRTQASSVIELYPGLAVMAVVGNVNTGRFEDITTCLLSHVEEARTRVILLDLCAAVVEDASVARELARMVRTVRLLGADCIIANMGSTLARAMEPLMADLGLLKSYSSSQTALEEALNTIGYRISQKA